MTIKIYPSRLEGEPVETHIIGEDITIEDWLKIETKGLYDPKMTDKHPTINVNGKRILQDNWHSFVMTPDDDVEVWVEAKGLVWGIVAGAALIFGAVVAMRMAKKPNAAVQRQTKEIGQLGELANTVRWGDPIPEIAGSPIVYPDYLTPPRRYYSNLKEQWLEALLCLGVGEFQIDNQQMWIGDTRVSLLGNDAEVKVYAPNNEIDGSHRQWWHTAEEVGFTMLGGAGMTLNPAQGIPLWLADRIDAAGTEVRGYDLSGNPVPVPDAWENGMVLSVVIYTTVTVSGASIQSELLDTLDLEVGDNIAVGFIGTGDDEIYTYPITAIIEGGAGEPTSYVTPLSNNWGAGTRTAAVGRAGLLYSVTGISGNSLQIAPQGVEFWAGFPTQSSDTNNVIDMSEGVEGGWVGPFECVPLTEEATAFEVDYTFPQGLYRRNHKNKIRVQPSRTYVQWRYVGKSSWNEEYYYYESTEQDQIGFTKRINLPAPGRIEVRMRRGPWYVDDTGFDKVQWTGLRALITGAPSSYPFTTVFVRMRSGDRLAGAVENKFSMRARRVLPTVEDPLITKPTRDIAPFFIHLMESVGYGREHIDMAQLTALHTLWKQRGDTFDLSVDSESTLKTVANHCLGAGFAELTLKNGKITAVRDAYRVGSPTRIYSPQEFIKGGELVESTETPMPDNIDGVDAVYVDYATGRETTVSYRLPGDRGIRVAEIKVPGVTNETRAWRLAARERRAAEFRRTTYKGTTELAAMNSYYMDFVGLQDGIPEFGQSAFVVDFSYERNRLTLSDPIEGLGSGALIIIRAPNGEASTPIEVDSINGVYVYVPNLSDYSISADPNRPTVVYLGSPAYITAPALITEIRPQGDSRVALTALNMDNRVYAEDDLGIGNMILTSRLYPLVTRDSSHGAYNVDVIFTESPRFTSRGVVDSIKMEAKLDTVVVVLDVVEEAAGLDDITFSAALDTVIPLPETHEVYPIAPSNMANVTLSAMIRSVIIDQYNTSQAGLSDAAMQARIRVVFIDVTGKKDSTSGLYNVEVILGES